MKDEDFQEIYKKYQKFSANTAYRITGDRTIAEDICQEVFSYLYKSRKRLDFSNERKVKALLFITTANKCRDYYKKPWKKHETALPEKAAERADEKSDPEFIALGKEESHYRKMVLRRLRQISPVNYEILMQVSYFGWSAEEVAEEYGMSRNCVNNRIYRTRRWMEKELRRLREKKGG